MWVRKGGGIRHRDLGPREQGSKTRTMGEEGGGAAGAVMDDWDEGGGGRQEQ